MEKYITMGRPREWKGVDIFLEIAKKMPNRRFLAVGNTDRVRELKRLKNVKYIKHEKDMRKVYAKTRILLIPSIMQEAFSRTGIEAMINGIPVIASNVGGSPELLDKAGIVIKDYFNSDKWVKAIKRLDNKKYYDKLSRRAVKHVNKFHYMKQVKALEKLMKPYVEKVELKKWLRRFKGNPKKLREAWRKCGLL